MKRTTIFLAILILLFHQSLYAAVVVQMTKGHAEVRRGVSEEWKTLLVGDVLRPEDTIRTGEEAEVKLQIGEKEYFVLHAFSMIDIADIRQISKNDLLLKLSLEHIRSIPNSRPGLQTPSTTVMHGDDKSLKEPAASPMRREASGEIGTMRLEGAKALYQQKYFSSTILSVKAAARRFGIRDWFSAHRIIAQAFERLGLIQQAIDEFASCNDMQINEAQQQEVRAQIARLKELVR